MFYKSTFSASNIHYSSYSTFECLFSSFKFPSYFTFVIALIYKPPTSSLPLFFEEFLVLSETLYIRLSLFFILGDFNILHENRLNFYFSKLDDILDLSNLIQHANFPTHTAGNPFDYVSLLSLNHPSLLNLLPFLTTLLLIPHSLFHLFQSPTFRLIKSLGQNLINIHSKILSLSLLLIFFLILTSIVFKSLQ